MQQTHERHIKGLSIATIVLAGISILGIIIAFLGIGVAGTVLGSMGPEAYVYEYDYGSGYGYGHHGPSGYYSDVDEYEIVMLLMSIAGVFCVFALIACAVILVAGIIGVRFANDPQKLGMIFGWSIAGAVVSLLCGSIVTMVLLIIVAVFSYKDKQYHQMRTVGYGAPVGGPGVPPVSPVPPMAADAPTPAVQPPVQPVAPPNGPAPEPMAHPAASPAPEASLETQPVPPISPSGGDKPASTGSPATKPDLPPEQQPPVS